MLAADLDHQLGKLADRQVVRRVADVVDLAGSDSVVVAHDAHDRIDAIVDVREATTLAAAVDEADVLAARDMGEELRRDARAAFLRGRERVQARAHPVERADQREIQAVALAVRPDDPVEQLLAARVDPALLLDRPEHEVGRLRMELRVAAHAVDLGRRREDHALLVLHALADQRQVRLEVELEHAQRFLDISRRRRDRDQRQDHVALADVVLHPLVVDRDVALEEMEPRIAEERADAVVLHVHAPDLPVRLRENLAAEMVANEAVNAEDQDFLHRCLPVVSAEPQGLGTKVRRAGPGVEAVLAQPCIDNFQLPAVAADRDRDVTCPGQLRGP